MTKEIIVVREKHGDWYYDASTPEDWAASSLQILTSRFNEGYWYLTPEEMYPDDSKYSISVKQLIPDFPEDGTKEEKEASILEYRTTKIETIEDEDARRVVEKKLSSASKNHNEKLKYVKWYKEVKRIVEDQDLSTVTVGKGKWERQEPRAWRILEERSDYEYEYVSLERLEGGRK